MWQALDDVIYLAQRNGVRLFLSLVNNWKDYGGKAKYVAWAKAAGERVDSDDDFFRNSKCRQFYKDHVKVCLYRTPCKQNLTSVALLELMVKQNSDSERPEVQRFRESRRSVFMTYKLMKTNLSQSMLFMNLPFWYPICSVPSF